MSLQSPNLGPKPDTEDVHFTLERANNGWDTQNANRDWVIFAALVVIYLVLAGVMFL
ncbi:MAG: hypothetical protein IT331_19425 [Anaerolineae bacterium]|nr:hypothetical protein [Anaerolineae bacterium]